MIPNFPARLRAVLIEKNLSQTKFAVAIGVKQQTVSEWLQGKCLPSLDTYRTICEVLQIDAGYLLSI